MEKVELTRAQIEFNLESGLTNQMVQYDDVRKGFVVGKLQRLSVTFQNGELIVSFQLKDSKALLRYEADLHYFIENTVVLYADTAKEKPTINQILAKQIN